MTTGNWPDIKWPAIVQFDNSDELDIIEDAISWQHYACDVSVCCKLIASDAAIYSVTPSTANMAAINDCAKTLSVEDAIDLARQHMSAQSHCCVSKFSARTVALVIAEIARLENE